MNRIALSAAVVTTLLGVLLVGCSSGTELADNQVSGIVTEVTTDLSVVESFVVLDDKRNSYLFRPAPGLLLHGGPLVDLRDNVITGQRVTVTFESVGRGEKMAVVIEHEDPASEHQVPDTSNAS